MAFSTRYTLQCSSIFTGTSRHCFAQKVFVRKKLQGLRRRFSFSSSTSLYVSVLYLRLKVNITSAMKSMMKLMAMLTESYKIYEGWIFMQWQWIVLNFRVSSRMGKLYNKLLWQELIIKLHDTYFRPVCQPVSIVNSRRPNRCDIIVVLTNSCGGM